MWSSDYTWLNAQLFYLLLKIFSWSICYFPFWLIRKTHYWGRLGNWSMSSQLLSSRDRIWIQIVPILKFTFFTQQESTGLAQDQMVNAADFICFVPPLPFNKLPSILAVPIPSHCLILIGFVLPISFSSPNINVNWKWY